MDFVNSQAGAFSRVNEASLASRPWTRQGYKFRAASQHDQEGHEFRASHPYFGWVQAQVDHFDFTMFSNNDDGVAMVYHAFGPDSYESASVAAWAMIAPLCSTIADVGAFTGLFSIIAHRLSPDASVLAVEPNSAARARMFINLVANGCYPLVQVAPYAVTDKVSTLPLHIAWGPDILDTGSSLRAATNTNSPSRSEIVTAAPIDVLLDQYEMSAPDLLKIDVEGLEDIALAGASRALAALPTIFLEIQDAEKFAACQSILSRHGYRLSIIDDQCSKLVSYSGEHPSVWFNENVGHRVLNFFCCARHEHAIAAERGVARISALID